MNFEFEISSFISVCGVLTNLSLRNVIIHGTLFHSKRTTAHRLRFDQVDGQVLAGRMMLVRLLLHRSVRLECAARLRLLLPRPGLIILIRTLVRADLRRLNRRRPHASVQDQVVEPLDEGALLGVRVGEQLPKQLARLAVGEAELLQATAQFIFPDDHLVVRDLGGKGLQGDALVLELLRQRLAGFHVQRDGHDDPVHFPDLVSAHAQVRSIDRDVDGLVWRSRRRVVLRPRRLEAPATRSHVILAHQVTGQDEAGEGDEGEDRDQQRSVEFEVRRYG